MFVILVVMLHRVHENKGSMNLKKKKTVSTKITEYIFLSYINNITKTYKYIHNLDNNVSQCLIPYVFLIYTIIYFFLRITFAKSYWSSKKINTPKSAVLLTFCQDISEANLLCGRALKPSHIFKKGLPKYGIAQADTIWVTFTVTISSTA